MTRKRRNIIAFFLLLFLFVRPIGAITDNNFLLLLGWHYLVSPLPIPFNDIGPHENYTQLRTYKATLVSGEQADFNELRSLTGKLGGPHRHKIGLMGVFIYGAIVPEPVRASVYDYIACDNHDVTGEELTGFVIQQRDLRTGVVMHFSHTCT